MYKWGQHNLLVVQSHGDHYLFFDFEESSGLVSGVVVTKQPLEALKVGFRQSFAIWPPAPQNMQSLLSKQCFHSSEVSLPSLPSFDVRSGLGVEEVEVEVFPLTLGEALEPLEFMEDVTGVLLDLEEGAVEGFA